MSVKSMSADWTMVQTLPFVVGAPNPVALTLATAFQATDPTKAATISINLNSVASITLGGGTVNTADVLIGATNAVATGTGTIIGKYRNTLSGAVVVGVGINSDCISQIQFMLPIGWFYAVRQTAGTIVIVSAFDQSVVP